MAFLMWCTECSRFLCGYGCNAHAEGCALCGFFCGEREENACVCERERDAGPVDLSGPRNFHHTTRALSLSLSLPAAEQRVGFGCLLHGCCCTVVNCGSSNYFLVVVFKFKLRVSAAVPNR
ncbi:unnamed protein product [Ectocarpus fasciculatus]